MGATYTPKQQNWRWYQDNAAEPTISYASAENTSFTLADSTAKLRLRICVKETGGKGDTAVTITSKYSTNQVDWYSMAASAAWNYTDGAATEGNAVTTFLLTDTTVKSEYCESGTNIIAVASGAACEIDLCLTPGAGIVANTLYYFEVIGDGTQIPLNTGETYPNLTSPNPVLVTPTTVPQNIIFSAPVVIAVNNQTLTPSTLSLSVTLDTPIITIGGGGTTLTPDTAILTLVLLTSYQDYKYNTPSIALNLTNQIAYLQEVISTPTINLNLTLSISRLDSRYNIPSLDLKSILQLPSLSYGLNVPTIPLNITSQTSYLEEVISTSTVNLSFNFNIASLGFGIKLDTINLQISSDTPIVTGTVNILLTPETLALITSLIRSSLGYGVNTSTIPLVINPSSLSLDTTYNIPTLDLRLNEQSSSLAYGIYTDTIGINLNLSLPIIELGGSISLTPQTLSLLISLFTSNLQSNIQIPQIDLKANLSSPLVREGFSYIPITVTLNTGLQISTVVIIGATNICPETFALAINLFTAGLLGGNLPLSRSGRYGSHPQEARVTAVGKSGRYGAKPDE